MIVLDYERKGYRCVIKKHNLENSMIWYCGYVELLQVIVDAYVTGGKYDNEWVEELCHVWELGEEVSTSGIKWLLEVSQLSTMLCLE